MASYDSELETMTSKYKAVTDIQLGRMIYAIYGKHDKILKRRGEDPAELRLKFYDTYNPHYGGIDLLPSNDKFYKLYVEYFIHNGNFNPETDKLTAIDYGITIDRNYSPGYEYFSPESYSVKFNHYLLIYNNHNLRIMYTDGIFECYNCDKAEAEHKNHKATLSKCRCHAPSDWYNDEDIMNEFDHIYTSNRSSRRKYSRFHSDEKTHLSIIDITLRELFEVVPGIVDFLITEIPVHVSYEACKEGEEEEERRNI